MLKLILLRSSIATLVAWLGAIIGFGVGSAAERHLLKLITAALGALLAVTLLDILPDALKLVSIPIFLLSIFSGVALFWAIGKFVYPVCPACSFNDTNVRAIDMGRVVVLISIALGIHSTMDGAAVVIGDSLSRSANTGVFFAVSLHKLPEGIALVLLLIGAGLSRRTALWYAIGIESATELGAVGALAAVSHLTPTLLGAIFANIGGGFLYLICSSVVAARSEDHVTSMKQNWVLLVSGAAGFMSTCFIMQIGSQLAGSAP